MAPFLLAPIVSESFALGAILFLVAFSIVTTVLWILTLIHAAKTERWTWFVVMLVFGLASLLYFFIEYESPAKMRAREARERKRSSRNRASQEDEIRALRREVAELRDRQAGRG